MTSSVQPVPTLVIGDDSGAIVDLLRDLQRAIVVHPEAARALCRTLAHEGELFAQTPEGAAWKAKLERSELVHRALLVWQTSTLWMMEDAGDVSCMPSAVVDAIAAAAGNPGRDGLLDRLFRELDGA